MKIGLLNLKKISDHLNNLFKKQIMTNQEVSIGKRNTLLTAIIFGIGCVGLLIFFLVAVNKGLGSITVLALDLIFTIGFGNFCYQSFRNYLILRKI